MHGVLLLAARSLKSLWDVVEGAVEPDQGILKPPVLLGLPTPLHRFQTAPSGKDQLGPGAHVLRLGHDASEKNDQNMQPPPAPGA
jgi:hypothetical protein